MDPFVDSHDHHNYGSSGDSSDLNTTELPASVPRYSSTGSRSPRYMAVSSPFMDPPMIPANSVTQPSALAHQRKHSRTSSVARGPIAATAVVGATTSTVVPESPLRQATSHSNNSLGERDNSPPLTLMDARSIPVPSTPPNYTGYQNGHHDTNVTPTGGNNGSVMTNTATASGTPPPSVAKPHKRRYIGDWDFVKTIGAGSMGQVKLAKNRVNSDLCAVKVVPRSHVDHHRSRHDKKDSDISKDIRTIREAAIGKLVNHKYICKMLEVYPMTNHIYLLFEYVSGGQMLDYIISHGSLKEKQARKFARSIASALDYLHRNSIVHRGMYMRIKG